MGIGRKIKVVEVNVIISKIKLVDFALNTINLSCYIILMLMFFQKICQRLFKQTRKDQTKVKECTKKYSQINSTN